jgi:hypothetical protein
MFTGLRKAERKQSIISVAKYRTGNISNNSLHINAGNERAPIAEKAE